MGAVLLPAWMGTLYAMDAWKPTRHWGIPAWVKGAPVALVVSLAVFELLRFTPVTRSLAIGFALASIPMLGLVRTRPSVHRVMLVGPAGAAAPWQAAITAHPNWNIQISHRLPAEPEQIARALADVDEVYLAASLKEATLRQILTLTEAAGLPLSMDAGFLGTRTEQATLVQRGGWPLITFSTRPRQPAAVALKRIIDLSLSGLALAACAPLLGLLMWWIGRHDGGPALFRQERIGQHGVPFTMLKLRTMHLDAHARLAELEPFNDVSGPAFRMPNDPRVTGPGRWLRRTGLDELPQLINILQGEMSLVGPRPPLPEEVARYAPWQHRRLSVPPGLTGLWQVRGRHLKQVDAWCALDLSYIDRWSVGLDLWLMLLTPLAVFRGWETDP